MDDQCERLADSVFFQVLTRRYRKLWMRAADGGMIVCVPQSCSLGRDSLTERDMENHIMAPVREVPGLYRTLSSKGVTVSGATVTTGEGFKRKREVRVLSPPLRIPADDAARDVFVTVMIINRPLHGGINAPAGTDEMSRHDMSLFFAMLRSFPENQVVVRMLNQFMNGISEKAKKNALDTVEPSLRVRIEEMLTSALAMLMQTACFHTTGDAAAQLQRRQLMQVLESYVMDRLHDDVFAWLRAMHRSKTTQLNRVLFWLKGKSQAELGIHSHFRCDYTAAVESLGCLPDCHTPLEKLQCLRDTMRLVTEAAEAHLIAIGKSIDDVDMSADDVLAILLYIIAQSVDHHHSEELVVHLDFIARFHFLPVSTTHLGKCLAQYQHAVAVLLSSHVRSMIVPVGASAAVGSPRKRSSRSRGSVDAAAVAGGPGPSTSPGPVSGRTSRDGDDRERRRDRERARDRDRDGERERGHPSRGVRVPDADSAAGFSATRRASDSDGGGGVSGAVGADGAAGADGGAGGVAAASVRSSSMADADGGAGVAVGAAHGFGHRHRHHHRHSGEREGHRHGGKVDDGDDGGGDRGVERGSGDGDGDADGGGGGGGGRDGHDSDASSKRRARRHSFHNTSKHSAASRRHVSASVDRDDRPDGGGSRDSSRARNLVASAVASIRHGDDAAGGAAPRPSVVSPRAEARRVGTSAAVKTVATVPEGPSRRSKSSPFRQDSSTDGGR